MATVPEYQRRVNDRPVNQQDISVRTSADSFGAGVGRATESLGNAVFKAADALVFKEQLIDDAASKQALSGFRDDERSILMDPSTGLLNRTGGNAIGVEDAAAEPLRKAREKHAAGLSPRARRMFEEQADAREDAALDRLFTHSSNEQRNYIVNAYGATIGAHIEDAAESWNDPVAFERGVSAAIEEQGKLAALQGWDPATLKTESEKLRSSALRQRVLLAAQVSPTAAGKLLDEASGDLSVKDRYELENDLRPKILEAQATEFVNTYTASGPPQYRPKPSFNGEGSGVKVKSSLGPRRPNMPDDEIVNRVAASAEATFGAGTTVTLTSGKENPGEQHGAHRHGTGLAVDFQITRPDGTVVKATDPDAKDLARNAAWRGVTGIGFGAEYMGGNHFHMDLTLPAGKGAIAWASGANGIEDELYGIMQQSGSLLRETGLPVNNLNERLVAQMGGGAAFDLIRKAQDTPGALAEKALPPEVIAANPKFKGKTVGEVYDMMAAAVGDDPSVRSGGPYFDVAGAYAEALKITDPALQAKVMEQITTRAAMQDRVASTGREEAQRQAWETFVRTGNPNVPQDLQLKMGQSGWVAFKSAAESEMQGVETITDPDVYETLQRQASSDPAGFAEANLPAHYGQLSKADRRAMVELQEAIRAKQRGDQLTEQQKRSALDYTPHFRVADVVYDAVVPNADRSPSDMTQEDRQQRLQFQKLLSERIGEFYDKEKREPNPMEVREMATVLTLPVMMTDPTAGFFGGGFDGIKEIGQQPLFMTSMRGDSVQYEMDVSYEDIPTAERAAIAAELMTRMPDGEIPDKEAITSAYEQKMLLSQGIVPNLTIAEVPEWLIAAEKDANPSASDTDIVEIYRAFLLSQKR